MIAMLAALALLQDSPGLAPADQLTTRPAWAQFPLAEVPRAAIRARVARAVVQLSCTVTETGVIQDCEVVTDKAPQYGFGPAAIRAAEPARMTPGRVGDRPVATRVNVPITFRTARS